MRVAEEVRRGFWRISTGTISAWDGCWRDWEKLPAFSQGMCLAGQYESHDSASDEVEEMDVSSDDWEAVSDHTEAVDVDAALAIED